MKKQPNNTQKHKWNEENKNYRQHYCTMFFCEMESSIMYFGTKLARFQKHAMAEALLFGDIGGIQKHRW